MHLMCKQDEALSRPLIIAKKLETCIKGVSSPVRNRSLFRPHT